MPSDPRLTSALKLAAAVARMRAAEDWEMEAIETGEPQGEEGPEAFVLVLRLRWAEAAPADPDELQKFIL